MYQCDWLNTKLIYQFVKYIGKIYELICETYKQ